MSTVRTATAAALVAALAATTPGHATSAPARPAPVVIAIVGESGLNVLHHDFRATHPVTYPKALGRVVLVDLPARGSFADRHAAVAAGRLGHLQPGVLYGIRGTRLLVASAPSEQPVTDVNGSGTTTYSVGSPEDPTLHGTGVVDAAIGTRYGTAPDALALVVLGGMTQSWDWLGQQGGVDVASMSDYEPGTRCAGAKPVRAMSRAGTLVLSSSGNTTDEVEPLVSPNGLPEVYQVGGVTADGTPYGTSPNAADSNPFYGVGQVSRPYRTGELYDFTTAGYDGDTTTMRFGGTSGATPRTAGWAARLIGYARAMHSRPKQGPLRDGRLDRSELTALLEHVAKPSMTGATAYWTEGYGALSAGAIRRAEQVLDGSLAQPDRATEDADEARVEQARAAAFADC